MQSNVVSAFFLIPSVCVLLLMYVLVGPLVSVDFINSNFMTVMFFLTCVVIGASCIAAVGIYKAFDKWKVEIFLSLYLFVVHSILLICILAMGYDFVRLKCLTG